MTDCGNPDHARALVMAAEERKSLDAIEAAMDAAGVVQGYLATWLPKALAVIGAVRRRAHDAGDGTNEHWPGDKWADRCTMCRALATLDDEERDAEPPAWQARVAEAEQRRDDALRVLMWYARNGGERAHCVGCACGGRRTPDDMTCAEALTATRAALMHTR